MNVHLAHEDWMVHGASVIEPATSQMTDAVCQMLYYSSLSWQISPAFASLAKGMAH